MLSFTAAYHEHIRIGIHEEDVALGATVPAKWFNEFLFISPNKTFSESFPQNIYLLTNLLLTAMIHPGNERTNFRRTL